jgi:hypothetical protein
MKQVHSFKRIDFLFSAGSTLTFSLITFVYQLFVKVYVLPYELGIFTTASLALSYLGYLQLGVLNSYNRDYPKILGCGDMAAAEKLRRNVFSFIVILYASAAVVGIAGMLLLVRLHLLGNLLGIGLAVNVVNAGLATLYIFFDSSIKSLIIHFHCKRLYVNIQ